MSGMRLKETLAKGGRVFGTFFQYMTNPAVVEVLPDRGLDFVVVNAEHNALDLADFLAVRWALAAKGIACLARVHGRDADDVAKACDSFADGVVVPYVEDVEELRQLVAAAKYRPLKGKALQRAIEDDAWPSAEAKAYIEAKCANTFFCAMIESTDGIENLDAICSVGGIDALLIGPNDLSVSLGLPDDCDCPAFVDAVQRVIDAAESHGMAAGAHFPGIAQAQRLIEQGGRFIPFSSDKHMLDLGTTKFLARLGADVPETREDAWDTPRP